MILALVSFLKNAVAACGRTLKSSLLFSFILGGLGAILPGGGAFYLSGVDD
jgi:hypothetical protein